MLIVRGSSQFAGTWVSVMCKVLAPAQVHRENCTCLWAAWIFSPARLCACLPQLNYRFDFSSGQVTSTNLRIFLYQVKCGFF